MLQSPLNGKFPDVGDSPGGATVTSQVPKPRMSPDVAREKAQSSVARLEKELGAMGDVVALPWEL